MVDSDALESSLRFQGRRAKVAPAISTGRGGTTGGVILATSKHIGLSRVDGHTDVLEPGRVCLLHMGGVLPGGILIASIYLHHSIGLPPPQLDHPLQVRRAVAGHQYTFRDHGRL